MQDLGISKRAREEDSAELDYTKRKTETTDSSDDEVQARSGSKLNLRVKQAIDVMGSLGGRKRCENVYLLIELASYGTGTWSMWYGYQKKDSWYIEVDFFSQIVFLFRSVVQHIGSCFRGSPQGSDCCLYSNWDERSYWRESLIRFCNGYRYWYH